MSDYFKPKNYKPLDTSSLKNFIIKNKNINKLIGDTDDIKIQVVGDGNLNLVFFADTKKNSLCIKQPLPYLRFLKIGLDSKEILL